jgi:hypothetical protein
MCACTCFNVLFLSFLFVVYMGQGLHIMGYFAEWDFEICGGLMKMEMCVEA